MPRLTSSKGRTRGTGRASKVRQTTPPPRSPSVPSNADSDTQSAASSNVAEQHSLPKRSKLTKSDLTPQEEEIMAEWLRENPQIFNKKLGAYKEKGKKDAAWNDQAHVMGKDVRILRVWYKSIRTRYGRMTNPKSGAGAADRSERDLWILDKFKFLQAHIHPVQPRTVISVSYFCGICLLCLQCQKYFLVLFLGGMKLFCLLTRVIFPFNHSHN